MSLSSILIRDDFAPGALADGGLWRAHLTSGLVAEKATPFLVGHFVGLSVLRKDPRARIQYVFRLLFFIPGQDGPWLSIDLDGQEGAWFIGGHDRRSHFTIRSMSEDTNYGSFRAAALTVAARRIVDESSADLDVGAALEEARRVRAGSGGPEHPPGIAIPINDRITMPCPLCTSKALWRCAECDGRGKITPESGDASGSPCTSCGGGRSEKRTCPVCGGGGSVDLVRVPCGMCWAEGTTSCEGCSGTTVCGKCQGSCLSLPAGKSGRHNTHHICSFCHGSGECTRCGGRGTWTCPACRGECWGDARLLWWNAFRAGVTSGNVDDLTLAHRLFLPLVAPGDRGPAVSYALEELRGRNFPTNHMSRLERFSKQLVTP